MNNAIIYIYLYIKELIFMVLTSTAQRNLKKKKKQKRRKANTKEEKDEKIDQTKTLEIVN